MDKDMQAMKQALLAVSGHETDSFTDMNICLPLSKKVGLLAAGAQLEALTQTWAILTGFDGK